MKKIVSLVVAMLMLLTIVSVPAFAADYSITPNGAALAKYGTTYTLTINVNTPGQVYGAGCFVAYDASIFEPVIADITGCAALNANLAEVVMVNGGTALKINSTNDAAAYSDAAAWATIPFTVDPDGTEATEATFELIYSDDDADLNGQITWLDDGFNEVAFDAITFGSIDVNVVPAHETPGLSLFLEGEAMSGEELWVEVDDFQDNWGLTPVYAYQWLADGVEIAGATDEVYALDADDYGKRISAKVTATVASDDEATNTVTETTEASEPVAVPDEAPVLTVAETRDDTVAVGTAIAANASATIDALVGGRNIITYSWKVDGVEVGTDATYTIATTDYVDGDEMLTCDVTVTNDRNELTDSATITFTNAIVAGNMPPVVTDVALEGVEEEAAVVGTEVVATYNFNDVADATNTPEDLDGGVIVTWFIDEEEIFEGEALVIDKAWIGETIDVVFAPWSNDNTPNEILGYTEEELLAGEVEVLSFVVEPDLTVAPVVSDVKVLGGAIHNEKAFTVNYKFTDINGFPANCDIAVYKVEDDSEVEATVNGSKVTIANEELVGTALYITVTPLNPEGYEYEAELVAAASEELILGAKPKSGGGGGGVTSNVSSKPSQAPTTEPTVEPTVEPTEEPTEAPTTEPTEEPTEAPTEAPVPAAKDCISLVIDNTAINAYGESYTSDVAPFIVNDRTVLPVRAICELLGAKVEWIEATRSVILHFDGRTVELKIDSNKAVIDGVETELNIAPFITSDRTFLGLRDMAEAINMNVEWHDSVRTVSITAK